MNDGCGCVIIIHKPILKNFRCAKLGGDQQKFAVHTHSKRGSSVNTQPPTQPNSNNEYLRPTPPPSRLQAVSPGPFGGGLWGLVSIGRRRHLFFIRPALSLVRAGVCCVGREFSLARQRGPGCAFERPRTIQYTNGIRRVEQHSFAASRLVSVRGWPIVLPCSVWSGVGQ